MVDGRKAPGSMYYVGRGKDGQVQTSTKPHNAALMTEALAELLVTKLNNTGHHAEVCELLADETSTIHDSLVDIGDAQRTSGVLVRHFDYKSGVMRIGGKIRIKLCYRPTLTCLVWRF